MANYCLLHQIIIKEYFLSYNNVDSDDIPENMFVEIKMVFAKHYMIFLDP